MKDKKPKPIEHWLKGWSFGADTKTDVFSLIEEIQKDAFDAGKESPNQIEWFRGFSCGVFWGFVVAAIVFSIMYFSL